MFIKLGHINEQGKPRFTKPETVDTFDAGDIIQLNGAVQQVKRHPHYGWTFHALMSIDEYDYYWRQKIEEYDAHVENMRLEREQY